MAIFSKTCEYAIRAVLFIAHKSSSGQKIGIRDVAAGIDSPELYLGKILQELKRKGIIGSAKGPNGGFFLTRDMLERPLIEIVSAVDGDSLFTGCGLGLKQCSETNPCPLHNEFKEIRSRITAMLSGTTIGSFNSALLEGIFSLKK